MVGVEPVVSQVAGLDLADRSEERHVQVARGRRDCHREAVGIEHDVLNVSGSDPSVGPPVAMAADRRRQVAPYDDRGDAGARGNRGDGDRSRTVGAVRGRRRGSGRDRNERGRARNPPEERRAQQDDERPTRRTARLSGAAKRNAAKRIVTHD